MRFLLCKSFIAPLTAALAAIAISACGGNDDDLPFAFSATLTGAEALPSNASGATGIGLVTVDPDRRTLTASIFTTGMADTDAHMHEAPTRATGSVVFPLAKAPGAAVWSTRTALTEAQLSALQNGNYYFDVHSAAFPGGEIRGQIVWDLPSQTQLSLLWQIRHQSALLAQQLEQVQEIEEARDWHGFGFGLTVGF